MYTYTKGGDYMRLIDLKALYNRKGDFCHAFQWYIPISLKLKLGELVKKQLIVSESIAVKEAIETFLAKIEPKEKKSE